jgi:hypothetical protein
MYSLIAQGELMMSSGLTEKIKNIRIDQETSNPLLPESFNRQEHRCSIELNGNRFTVSVSSKAEDCDLASRILLKLTAEILLNAYSLDMDRCSSITQIKEIKLISCEKLDQN